MDGVVPDSQDKTTTSSLWNPLEPDAPDAGSPSKVQEPGQNTDNLKLKLAETRC